MMHDPVEESLEDLYEHAPCGYVSTGLDGRIVRVNQTFLDWTGYARSEMYAATRLPELFSVGSRIHHETHVTPILRVHGSVREIAAEIRCADDRTIPVFFNAVVRHVERSNGSGVGSGRAATAAHTAVVRYTFLDATERRAYERELLDERRRAEAALDQVRQLENLLPMCAWCRRVRSDAGYWQRLEEYLVGRGTTVTHGICDECASRAVGPSSLDQT